MTKRLRILALGLMIVVLLATLSGCSVDGVKDKIMGIIGPYLPGCQHEGGNATCTEQAVCEKCGETYGNVLGHDIVVDAAKAPTCTETGLTEGKHCTRCDYKVAQETVAALGHTEVVDAAVAATCTKTGLTEGKHCSVCEEVLVAQTETPVIAHTYDEGWDADCNVCGTVRTCAHDGEKTVVAGKGATCTEAGLTDGEKCAICGDVTKNQEEIPALGHDMADATCTAPATCKREGCGHTQGTVKDHTYDEGKITTAPTCTEAGVKTYTCSACGATKTETVDATGHTEVVDAAKDATCTETGLTEGKHCSVCNKVLVKQTEVPVIPHTYDDKYDATCNVCGFERDAECAHTNTVKLEGKDATCDEAGLTAGEKCADCEEILVAQTVVPALGHTEETVAGKDATCTEDGLTAGKKCSVCGETLVAQEVVPALGHTEGTVAGKDATCTEDGLTEGKKCSVCGETLVAQTVVPALGHTEETVAGKDATCTEDGLTEGKKCSVCGETLVAQQVVPATGHTEEVVPGIDPDCENTGLTAGKKCSVCGVVLAPREEIDSLGHKWNEGEVTTAPTCTVEGVKTFTCGTCGGTKTEDVSVTGHAFVDGVCQNGCGESDPNYYYAVTIPEALEKADGSKVQVSGTVCEAEAWNTTFKNMSVTIIDANGNKLYIYRLATQVKLGDIITVQGTMATYEGDRQIAQGATATVTGHDESYDVIPEYTIPDALNAADGTNVVVTGTVVSIKEAYNSQYDNICVFIADENGVQLYVYRLKGNVEVGQIIKVKGSMATYGGARQIAQGGTFEAVGTHTCSKWTEATCKEPAKCVVCGTAKDDVLSTVHNYVDGVCTVCLKPDPSFEGDVIVLKEETLSIFANKGTLGDKVITWTGEAFTFSNAQNKSSNPIRTTDSSEFRAYQGSQTTISGSKIKKVVITCTSPSYASVCANSVETEGVTVEIDGSVVTITVNAGSVDTIVIGSTAQWRLNKVTVIYQEGGVDPSTCEHENITSSLTAPTCTEAGYTTYTCNACGYSYNENGAEKLGHDWSNNDGECARTDCDEKCEHDGVAAGAVCTVCGVTTPAEEQGGVVEKMPTTKYSFSSYSAGVQYAKGEVHTLDANTKLTINGAHLNTQIRLYSGSNCVFEWTKTVEKIKLNAGNKAGTLTVYVSNDGETWTSVKDISTTTSMTEYTVDLGGSYRYVKLQSSGAQIRVSILTVNP